MWERIYHFKWITFLLMGLAVGCSTQPAEKPTDKKPGSPAASDEDAVREKFAELLSAIKRKDGEKLWEILDKKSHTDAEREAKGIQSAYAKANPEEKAKQEEKLGLSSGEVAGLTGKGILKTNRFQRKYDELPDSKIEKVVIQGDNATVHYLETDGDHEKLILIRHDGQWKVWLPIPRISQP